MIFQLPPNVMEKLSKMASEVGLPAETLCSLILGSFVTGAAGSPGGKVIAGTSEKGKRIVIDWPEKYVIIKVPERR